MSPIFIHAFIVGLIHYCFVNEQESCAITLALLASTKNGLELLNEKAAGTLSCMLNSKHMIIQASAILPLVGDVGMRLHEG